MVKLGKRQGDSKFGSKKGRKVFHQKIVEENLKKRDIKELNRVRKFSLASDSEISSLSGELEALETENEQTLRNERISIKNIEQKVKL